MDPFTIGILGGGALLSYFSGRSQQSNQERLTNQQLAHQAGQLQKQRDHDDKWRTRDDAWRQTMHGQSERDRQVRHALMRAHREDFRPWQQTGQGALSKLRSALGITPAAGMGGDPHVPEHETVSAPTTLGELAAAAAAAREAVPRDPHVTAEERRARRDSDVLEP